MVPAILQNKTTRRQSSVLKHMGIQIKQTMHAIHVYLLYCPSVCSLWEQLACENCAKKGLMFHMKKPRAPTNITTKTTICSSCS